MKTYAILNQKGGVGKTTTVANVAAALARLGKRVVVMDMDPQAHLTIHFGINADEDGSGTYDLLTRDADFLELLRPIRENLWLLGANIDLVGAESELVSVVGRETILREAIAPYGERFDYLLIDCPPSLGLLTLNALAAVQEIIIPIQPHFLALQGFGKLLQTVTLVNKRINPELRISSILLCMFDSRTSLSTEVKNDIDRFLKNAHDTDKPWADAEIIPVHIRRNIKLAEAPSYGQSIFEYEPSCNGAIDYQFVAEYLLKKDFPEQSKDIEPGEGLNSVAEQTIDTPDSAANISDRIPIQEIPARPELTENDMRPVPEGMEGESEAH